ncbi:hypothetical protein CN689_15190 [Peribacillus butanolivorans]|uniref:Uncharacterized protein n=1 Tax=Peribacillus butanolivorans TaxID=421767 RepID=A0AAX0RZP0_9BACI|nr:hypothetical protein [Peribacillus butanolivorans]PEJ31979.1 hypothetical protein CN689_15190 [Peribacillus butanolivorans]
MKPEILSTAIETLTELFFTKNKETDFLAMRTMECYISDLDLLSDISAVAVEIERQGTWALVPKFKLFNMRAADEIEVALCGLKYTDAEIIASDIVFEEWKKSQNHCQ